MFKVIKLTQNQFTIVDLDDYNKFNNYKWYYKDGYAVRSSPKDINGKQKTIRLHREIINCPKDLEVDHINGDKLDNRKENLRVCTHNQNGKNRRNQTNKKSSKYKGVFYKKSNKKWVARITFNNKRIWLGYFKTEKEAAIEYNKFALKYYKEYANLNKIG